MAISEHPEYRIGQLEAKVTELTTQLNQSHQVNSFLIAQLANANKISAENATEHTRLTEKLNEIVTSVKHLVTVARASHNIPTGNIGSLLDCDHPAVSIQPLQAEQSPPPSLEPISTLSHAPDGKGITQSLPPPRASLFPPPVDPEARKRETAQQDAKDSQDAILLDLPVSPPNSATDAATDHDLNESPLAKKVNTAKLRLPDTPPRTPTGPRSQQIRRSSNYIPNNHSQEEHLKQWHTVGLRFDPGTTVSRVVMITDIPTTTTTTVADVMNAVKGGVIISCTLLHTSQMKLKDGQQWPGNAVRVEFAHPSSAERFVKNVKDFGGADGLPDGARVKLLATSTFPLSPRVRENVFRWGHTRVLDISRFELVEMEEALRSAECLGGGHVLSVDWRLGNSAVMVVFASVVAAEEAKEWLECVLRACVTFARDPCAAAFAA